MSRRTRLPPRPSATEMLPSRRDIDMSSQPPSFEPRGHGRRPTARGLSTSVEADCRNSGLVRVLLVGTVLPTGTECRRRTELRSLDYQAPQTAKERASEELQARSTPRIPPPPLRFPVPGRNDPHDLTCNLPPRLAVLNLRRAVHWPEQEVGPGSLVRPSSLGPSSPSSGLLVLPALWTKELPH